MPAAVATAQNLEDVERQREGLEADLANLVAEQEELEARIALTEDELVDLETRADELSAEVVRVNKALGDRARSAYKNGFDQNPLALLISSRGPRDAIDKASLLEVLARRDDAQLETAIALRTQLDQVEILLRDRARELDDLEAQMQASIDAVSDRLSRVRLLEADLRERAARQRMIDRGVQAGIYACPVASPVFFVDSWGAPRSGGRRHKGVDMMAPYGNQLFAFTNGRISRMRSSSLGGISLYLWGDDGHEYYYAHLSGYASSAYVGKRVEAGELIGFNGDSGNARGGSPHLHFEVHLWGGAATNPYPWVRAVC
ncbi:MAG: peptidoglycan DD-metalloendopeptidase family protein [Nitriliruptorales bacterium]|nr:peptidoglycan DD-metalloendopeptidase family protein [Nitriliruptorales bacterium]